jgi:hypothetical protein
MADLCIGFADAAARLDGFVGPLQLTVLPKEHHMATKRSFSPDGLPMKAADYHGMAKYVRTSPDVTAQGIDSLNVYMTFEEALRFSLAVQSAVMNLNRYNRAAAAGRDMGLLLSLKTADKSVTVIERSV